MVLRVARLSRVLWGAILAAGLSLSLAPTSAAAATEKNRTASKKAVAKKPVAQRSASKAVATKKSTRKVARIAPRKPTTIARKKTADRAVVSAKRRVSDSVIRVAPPELDHGSVGAQLGLNRADDPLDLNSSVALVVDQQTNEVLLRKNDSAVLPVASLTKLMTGLVVADANLDMAEMITITQDDVDTLKGSRSRLMVGATLTRGELMHLALMSSENRAAHALGRTFPGGLNEFVQLMNRKANELGMRDTRYVEPTGLSSENRSSARDLALLVSAAYQRPILRDLSTSPGYEVDVGRRTLQYNNSNRLVKSPDWEIGLQKTGYISEAGRCLVMQAKIAGRQLILVFLDATNKLGRLQDAERVRRWVELHSDRVTAVHRPQG